jgi:pectate lyase
MSIKNLVPITLVCLLTGLLLLYAHSSMRGKPISTAGVEAESETDHSATLLVEGFGKATVGGTGGTLHVVTNLDDGGPCSLRDFVNRPGPRIIRFAVSGWIVLKSRLVIENPYLTIDGSDAPNGGIGIRGEGIDIGGHDIIIRHVRFRSDSWATDDAVQITGYDFDLRSPKVPHNIVLDHLSITAGRDGNLDISSGAHDITVQHCIIAENNGSGAILQRYLNATRVTYHHNLFANNPSNRNPTIHCGDVDVVNNVIYRNFSGFSFANQTAVGPDSQCRVNYVGNYFKMGSSESTSEGERQIYLYGNEAGSAASSIHVEGNISPARPSDSRPETDLVRFERGGLPISGIRHDFPTVGTSSAFTALSQVVEKSGATLPCRDTTDTRIAGYVMKGEGVSGPGLNSPSRLGGWPDLTKPCDSTK